MCNLPRRSPSSWKEREPRRRQRSFRSYSGSYSGSSHSGSSEQPMRPSPVEEGHEYDVTVESVGSKGDGIAKIQGFIIFVPGAKAGDNIKVRIATVRRNFAIAEPVAAGTPALAPEALPEEAGEATESPEVSPEEEGGE